MNAPNLAQSHGLLEHHECGKTEDPPMDKPEGLLPNGRRFNKKLPCADDVVKVVCGWHTWAEALPNISDRRADTKPKRHTYYRNSEQDDCPNDKRPDLWWIMNVDRLPEAFGTKRQEPCAAERSDGAVAPAIFE
jgi:hypothetical protein